MERRANRTRYFDEKMGFQKFHFDRYRQDIVYPVLKHKIQLFKDLLLFDKILAALISSEYKYGAT